ncbi:NADP-dependent oxidoreductase [Paenibacillus sp. CF384]|uniref:NADP-dependent oxidoreductase n=1 Tax=Paenibacillus sp. CF384 TaxID=1884382 RepID=UPI000897B80A|nr:NADP-dependent oxidoreductase [Paenibacillus sp. CF384]SDX61144.1 NADPH:quinone reductase [Paenibacillus sp. CF384]
MSNGFSDHMIKAIRVHQYGGSEELQFEEIPRPQPGEGEVLVRVHSAGVLPIEWKVREGMFKKFRPLTFPYIPGSSLAGIVEEVGPGVTAFTKGQAVFGRTTYGSYSEYALASADFLVPLPVGLTFDEAATISGGATTAWSALFEVGGLEAGERVLIHGAAGGVGLFAVQLAKWRGAEVIVTCGTDNVDYAASLGADVVVDYKQARFEDAAADVDLVLDTVGGETQNRSFEVLKPGGRLISLVSQPSAERAQERGVKAMFSNKLPAVDALSKIAALMADGLVKTHVGAHFQLAEAAKAQDLSQSGHGRGRIVLHLAD